MSPSKCKNSTDSSKNYKCTQCSKIFVQKSSLNSHIRCVHEKLKSHVCNVPNCAASFYKKSDLKRHKQGVHLKDRQYKCTRCTCTFPLPDTLRRHEKTVHSEKDTYECAECGAGRKDNLAIHLSHKHSDCKNFVCDICQQTFSKRYSVRRHKERVHNVPTPEDKLSVKPFLCELCARSFSSKYQLEKHLEKVHSCIIHKESHGSGRYVCDICKKSFLKRFNLNRHKEKIHKIEIPDAIKDPYICECCGLSFTSKLKLIKHFREKSSYRKVDEEKRRKLLTCPYPECRQTTSDFVQLRSHYKSAHRKDMTYKTKTFPTEQQFLQWKEEIEREMRCTFGKKYSKRIKDGRIALRVFRCNRSGVYEPRVIRKRKPRRFGSRKINAYCPAEIKVYFKESGILVKYLPEHVGHEDNNNFGYMNKSSSARKSVPSQLTRDDNYAEEVVCEYIDIPLVEEEQLWPYCRSPDFSYVNAELWTYDAKLELWNKCQEVIMNGTDAQRMSIKLALEQGNALG